MSPSRCRIEVSATSAASREAIWRLLADAGSFALWVAGTREIRDADALWPEAGATLYHRWGWWPALVRDQTTVVAVRAPEWLEMRANVRPIAVVRAWVQLRELAGGGTHVLLGEHIESGFATALPALARVVQRRRNRRSLHRLLTLAESR